MTLDLKFYLGLVLKRLPFMLALFLTCVGVATVSALKLKPTYSTSAQLLVEEAQIQGSMVGNVTQTDANQQLQVIEQKLLTRANMLDIARKFDVLENIRTMSPDAIVSAMRKQTNIRRSGGRGEATLMRVSFTARSGQTAANVVNEYVTLILQESTDFRMSRAESTLSFYDQEAKRLGEELDLQSAQIVAFKNANTNALPSDLSFRQSRQALLLERQARLEREIAALEKQRSDMIAIFESTGQIAAPQAGKLSPEQQRLEKLKSDLQQALVIYSETNPRIVILRNRITQLEETIRTQSAETGSAQDQQPLTLFEVTMAEMEQRIVAMNEELARVSDEVDALTGSIQATAGNAIELDALERDFMNIQSRYDDAVRNLNRARITERIEVSAQGQRISVLENASVPQKPSGPNRFRLIAVGVIAGGGLAAGFFLLLELLNRAIRRPAELQSRFGIIPLAVIPYMETRRDRLIRRTVLVAALIAVLIGVPMALWYVDTSYMPLDVLANKVFDRLGLT